MNKQISFKIDSAVRVLGEFCKKQPVCDNCPFCLGYGLCKLLEIAPAEWPNECISSDATAFTGDDGLSVRVIDYVTVRCDLKNKLYSIADLLQSSIWRELLSDLPDKAGDRIIYKEYKAETDKDKLWLAMIPEEELRLLCGKLEGNIGRALYFDLTGENYTPDCQIRGEDVN